ncbi:MAG: hypothetical protein Q8O35_09910 [Humidesulfovibrio sp.]|uniref:hypothetical protein n=1 Tax=Humidesulfovibrio sp. TaxID=2910988 RepID=UPI002733DC34|nr:hypothetical protein [Humidesulfovibrio sp.]MDP2848495.1 hypothetical protein [Humidesulfovibrio sp.]
MISNLPEFQELFDAKGQPVGALLGPEAWAFVRETVLSRFAPTERTTIDVEEPMQDWRDLVQYWDFKYPVDHDVCCGHCGNTTDAWELDEPRKFILTVANLGGLVTFRCVACQSKILKRHFKDVIKVETKPYLKEKSVRNLGRGI